LSQPGTSGRSLCRRTDRRSHNWPGLCPRRCPADRAHRPPRSRIHPASQAGHSYGIHRRNYSRNNNHPRTGSTHTHPPPGRVDRSSSSRRSPWSGHSCWSAHRYARSHNRRRCGRSRYTHRRRTGRESSPPDQAGGRYPDHRRCVVRSAPSRPNRSRRHKWYWRDRENTNRSHRTGPWLSTWIVGSPRSSQDRVAPRRRTCIAPAHPVDRKTHRGRSRRHCNKPGQRRTPRHIPCLFHTWHRSPSSRSSGPHTSVRWRTADRRYTWRRSGWSSDRRHREDRE
jgi:hypothetical protein